MKLFQFTIIRVLTFSLLIPLLPWSCRPAAEKNQHGFPVCEGLNTPADMKCIPGGPAVRGSSKSEVQLCCTPYTDKKIKDEQPEATVQISTFFMDTYEVTYEDFQKCKAAGKCSKESGPHYRGYDKPKFPILGVTWFDARNFCTWKGKRLPTEAEWEKAARGENGEEYPWGNEPATCKRAVIEENGKKGCGTGKVWNVGSRPAGRYGLYDMSGNAHEWVNDWFSESYEKCGKECLGTDPKGPCGGADKCAGHKLKVVRGGSWYWPAKYARPGHRRPHFPENKTVYHHFGFRCAKDIPAGE